MKYKILVVDDDKELVKMLCSYFNMKQYETITATDGMEALNKIKMKPDIILLDINMPRMDGIEVCRLIRSKVLCPILFLTARVDEDDKINGLLSGGDDYITKPFSLRELEARIVTNIKREERHQQKTEYRFMDEMLIDYSEKIVAIIFKNPLPAAPILFLHIIYSNMLTMKNDIYYMRPFSIMVRFPGRFFETHVAKMSNINQIILVISSVILVCISVTIWKRRRVH